MKKLIAVMSCEKNISLRNASRDTWVKKVDADVIFFTGQCNADDTISLNCSDDYNSCSEKQLRISQYCEKYDFDYIFHCDDDTFIVPDRFSEFEPKSHYLGFTYGYLQGYNDDPNKYIFCDFRYAQGGPGFFLSRKASETLSKRGDEVLNEEFKHSDVFVSKVMERGAFGHTHNPYFEPGWIINRRNVPRVWPNKYNNYITTHYVTPDLIRCLYDHFHGSCGHIGNRHYNEIGILFEENHQGRWYFTTQQGRKLGPFDSVWHAEKSIDELCKKGIL